ncbi:MAG: SDR family NAD(P)-dependent oxidoreductase [Actinomycetota bacterium]|nr:SDR family NAD(P)-dependent oxidoreductase [Actinomycetota bacterium]
MRLSGQVVFITGAESGIGRATALRAASEGADIGAVGLDADALDTLVADVHRLGRRAAARVADVSDAESVRVAVADLVGELGTLHVAHANAGILPATTTLEQLDLDEWNRVLAVNLTGVLNTFRASVPHFGEDGGVLLATGSSLAVRPGIGLLPYVAAKAGVHAIARSLALELAPRNIRVNVIAPGLTETPMTTAGAGHIERGLPAVPLGALVQPDEVAALAVHLMSDDARSVTGSVYTVDGGRTAV